MVGLNEAKSKFNELMAVARYDAQRKKHGDEVDSATMHLVLEGPPGTGKSTFAQSIARSYYGLGLVDSAKVTSVSGRDMVSPILGKTAQNVTEMFDEARGGVLFLDEAYGMVNGEQDEYGMEALTQFVKLTEERRDDTVVIIAGYDDTIDKLNRLNTGMASRFPPGGRVPFVAYTKKQLGDVAEKMAGERGFVMSDDVVNELRAAAGQVKGNARGARNLVGSLRDAIAERLMGADTSKLIPKRSLYKVKMVDVESAMRKMKIGEQE